jgi:hypothetical protein
MKSLALLCLILGVSSVFCTEGEIGDNKKTKEQKKLEALEELAEEVRDERGFQGTREEAKAEAHKRITALTQLKKLRTKLLECHEGKTFEHDDEPGDADENTLGGDMKPSKEQVQEMLQSTKEALEDCKSGKRSIRDFSKAAWSARKWDPVIEYDMTRLGSANQDAVKWCFEQYHQYVPCLTFKAVSSCRGRTNCMQFTELSNADNPNACWGNSPVGKNRDLHNINLSQCRWPSLAKSIAIHEIGHSFGLPHTQVRPDRDNYVKIHFTNVVTGMEHNFDKEASSAVTDYGQSYDFNSMMHYGPKTFSKNGGVTIEVLPQYTQYASVIGEAIEMSAGDKKLMNDAYCNGSPAPTGETGTATTAYPSYGTTTSSPYYPTQAPTTGGGTCLKDGQTYNEGQSYITGSWVKTCMASEGYTGFMYNGCAYNGQMHFNGKQWKEGGRYWQCEVDHSFGRISKKIISCSVTINGSSIVLKSGCVVKHDPFVLRCVDTGDGTSLSYTIHYSNIDSAFISATQQSGMKACQAE